jgi:hypothetical protein
MAPAIRALHEKFDTLREAPWAELARMQQERIGLLRRLLEATPGAAVGRPPQPRHDRHVGGSALVAR